MDFIKKKLNIAEPLQKGCAELGVDGDIIVPDVMPDILKVIQVDGNAVLISKTVENGKLTCLGKLDLKILYVPDAEDDKIRSIITSFDFSHVMSGTDFSDDTVIDISSDVSRVDFQLTNSRKLRIKSMVVLPYVFSRVRELEIACDADGENMLETKKKTVCAANFTGFKDTQFLVRESLQIPSGQASVGEVLKLDASVCDVDYKIITGRIVIKGVCGICALYKDEGGTLRYADFEMPFTEIIDIDDITEESLCELELTPGEIMYHTENDSDGDTRIIYTEVLVGVKCNAYECTEIEYIDDCYCPGHNLRQEKEHSELDTIISSCKKAVTVREVAVPPAGAPALSGIYNVIAKPVIDSVRPDDGKVCVEGRLVCYFLYICSGEMPVYSLRKEFSFSEMLEAEGCEKGADCRVLADVTHKSCSLNSVGETEIKASVNLDILVTKKTSVPVISEFEIEDLEETDKKGIVIYFTQKGDTLWEVAKRYKVKGQDIAELNNLEEEKLEKGMQLLIPSV